MHTQCKTNHVNDLLFSDWDPNFTIRSFLREIIITSSSFEYIP